MYIHVVKYYVKFNAHWKRENFKERDIKMNSTSSDFPHPQVFLSTHFVLDIKFFLYFRVNMNHQGSIF